jgi:AraC family carnitine catabolism transcriptional activator
MTLSIIQQDYGRYLAVVVSDMCLNCVNFKARSTQRSSFPYALGTRNPKLVQVINAMLQFIKEPLSLDEPSFQTGMPHRQINGNSANS